MYLKVRSMYLKLIFRGPCYREVANFASLKHFFKKKWIKTDIVEWMNWREQAWNRTWFNRQRLAAVCALLIGRVLGVAVQTTPQQAAPAPQPPLYIAGAFPSTGAFPLTGAFPSTGAFSPTSGFPPTSGPIFLGRPAALFYWNGPQVPNPPQNFPLRIIGYIATAPQQPSHPPPPPVYEDEESAPPVQHPLDGVLVVAAHVHPSHNQPAPPQHIRLIQVFIYTYFPDHSVKLNLRQITQIT